MTSLLSDPGSEIAFAASTGLERALDDVEALRMMAIPGRLITENIDPWKVKSGTNLTYLAYGQGVTLWEPDWSEYTKRRWLFDQWTFKANVGALPAYKMALETNGHDITDLVTPPGGFYASPDLTRDELDAVIRKMPQIRIKYASKIGTSFIDEFFCGDVGFDEGFADDGDVSLDDGPVLLGREAVLRYADGVEIPLEHVVEHDDFVSSKDESTTWERLFVPAVEEDAYFSDESVEADTQGNPADDSFSLSNDTEARIVSIRLDPGYNHEVSTLSLTAVDPGLQPLSPFYERDSDIGSADGYFYADDGTSLSDFVGINEAPAMLADRVYLLDPSVTIPLNAGVSFADIDRVGVPRQYAELLIDLHTTDPVDATYEDDNFVESSFAMAEDSREQEKALRAVRAAKALRDTILVSFEVARPLQVSDTVTDETKVGAWVPTTLATL